MEEFQMKKSCRAAMLMITVILLGVTITPSVKGEVIENYSFPTEIVQFIPCANGGAGEDVLLSGQLHMILSSTTNGNMIHYKIRSQPQGMSGVGSVTGDRYHAVGVSQSEYSGQVPSGQQFQETVVNNYRIIGHGPGNNFMVQEVFHVTYNESGEITVSFDKSSAQCK
jgi:hypothetical protein